MIKAYRIFSIFASILIYIGLIISASEAFFSNINFDYTYKDIFISLLFLYISTTTLVFTLKTRKIRVNDFKQNDIIDNLAEENIKILKINQFRLLSISNFITGLGFAMTCLIILITTHLNIFYLAHGLLPFLANLILVFYGILQMNYVLKISKKYKQLWNKARTANRIDSSASIN